MEVKTESGGTFDAAGKGTTGLGIVGTVLGGAALAMSGILGTNGLINPRGKTCDDERAITKSEFNQEKAFASLFADYKMEQAQRYTDEKVIKQAEKDATRDAKLAQDMLDIGIGVTRMNEQMKSEKEKMELRAEIIDYRFKNIEEKIKNSEDRLSGAIALESERRTNGDTNLFGYVNATFVPGKLYMPSASVTPLPMDAKNSWEAPTA